MASPNAVFTEMVSTTLRAHKREVVDNVSKNNALLTLMKERDNIKTESGGYEIAISLEYGENGTYQRYSGFDPLNINASDVISAAKYDWAQVALHVTASGRELRMNSGAQKMINLAKQKVKNAIHTAKNQFSIDLYSTGSLTNQIGGLAHLIQTNGQGTVGGIPSASYAFWQNEFQEMAGTNTYAEIRKDMGKLWLRLNRGVDKPDLIVSSHDLYVAYEDTLQDRQRYSDAKMAAAGFETLKYKTANIVFDDNSNFSTTAEKMYFLNTKYLYLVEHTDARWDQDGDKVPVNQDAVVIPIYWMGQLVCSNRKLQGVLMDAA